MGRIISIDYGENQTGLAVSDLLKMIASPLNTISSREVIIYLKNYTKTNDVELFILGEARQMNYSPSKNMIKIRNFKKKLKESMPLIGIEMADERFTSVLAHRAMIDGGIKKMKRRDKKLINKLSATILLQTYLESLKK
ncbi:MAG: Holliday junction resolvase RuvX [Bacteroidales bacterium OttesenSCG-928-I14]|jgi:putative Holliday junction resolvase|nr:Holliday junction resolvase RuvX [Bacteroidales bacterium OttesenSCG-928-I14]